MKGNFKIIFLIVFIAAAVFSVFVFSGAIPLGKDKNVEVAKGTVVLWGTVKATVMADLLDTFNNTNVSFVVRYVEKNPSTFNEDLLEAIASGAGPDMFLLPDDLAFDYANKIYLIPYAGYPLATFKNTYAGAGEVFLTSKGIIAFPITIDPLMMYYNRSILDSNAFTNPPLYWDEFSSFVPQITKKDENKKIVSSTVALGQFANVNNAKSILSTLFLQAGNNIVLEKEGNFYSDLSEGNSSNLSSILSFYTSFADPASPLYSWNRLLPNSRDFFSSDDMAFYFGFASELPYLVNKNPNLNFAVASVPQIKNTKNKATYGRVTGVAISKFSKNINTSLVAASLMSSSSFAKDLSRALVVAPATRAILAEKPADQYSPYFYASSLYAKSFLDPEKQETNAVFKNMVDEVLSNNATPAEAISNAGSQINFLLAR